MRLALLVLLAAALAACARTRPDQLTPRYAGPIRVESDAGFEETVARLRTAIAGKEGLAVMAELDHAANAAAAGLTLRPTRVLVFGNPAAGTPLMAASPTLALDLPLRMLVWEEGGRTFVAYEPPEAVAARHGLVGQEEAVGRIGALLGALAAEAAGR